MKYLISGGGTGGHIFPAVSIANALREADPSCEILFVGALGRMEMERVPQAGYEIIGLPVKGFDRRRPWRNVRVIIDLVRFVASEHICEQCIIHCILNPNTIVHPALPPLIPPERSKPPFLQLKIPH